MPPSIAPGAEVRRAIPTVGSKRRWNFRDAQTEGRGLHDHLTRKFHAQCPQLELFDLILAESAEAAMKIPHRTFEEQPSQSRQNRISQVAVQSRHRARQNFPPETIAHHQVIAFAEFRYKFVQL